MVNPLVCNAFSTCFLLILDSFIFIMVPVVVLMIVYTGFLFIAAQGRPEKLAEARRVFMWVLIGGTVLLGSKALAIAVQAIVASL